MKKIVFAIAIASSALTLGSCEKCKSCTYDDPTLGELTNEFCASGSTLEAELAAHEDNGWVCVDN